MNTKHTITLDTTNITELAELFPANKPLAHQSVRVIGVAPRFWQKGDTYEQALARQQIAWDRVTNAKAKGD